jgi:hypothetical protein
MHWFQYYDHPHGGRDDGEDYNFGLVDLNDRPYELLVDALTSANLQAARIHEGARHPAVRPSEAPWRIPSAAIDVRDRSLAEWPKGQALMTPLVAPSPEIAFGDLYVAWNGDGLYLAVIAMDYYDPDLLAYEGEFPLEEAFRVDWGVEGEAGPQRFALYIIPPRLSTDQINTKMRTLLCRMTEDGCEPIPGALTTYFGSEQPRITAELFLPWRALGVDHPPVSRTLRMVLTATAWHRSRQMSWKGLPAAAMHDPAQWPVTVLAE